MNSLGKYQHYKGGFYELIGFAKHSETLEELVIYKSIKDGYLWARPKKLFFEKIIVDGRKVPRFKKID